MHVKIIGIAQVLRRRFLVLKWLLSYLHTLFFRTFFIFGQKLVQRRAYEAFFLFIRSQMFFEFLFSVATVPALVFIMVSIDIARIEVVQRVSVSRLLFFKCITWWCHHWNYVSVLSYVGLQPSIRIPLLPRFAAWR